MPQTVLIALLADVKMSDGIDKINRVILCGVCVGTVKSLQGEDCEEVELIIASDGTVTRTVRLDVCENAQAVIYYKGVCYCAEAVRTEDMGISLSDAEGLLTTSPGLVTLLMQNLAVCLNKTGAVVSWNLTPDSE